MLREFISLIFIFKHETHVQRYSIVRVPKTVFKNSNRKYLKHYHKFLNKNKEEEITAIVFHRTILIIYFFSWTLYKLSNAIWLKKEHKEKRSSKFLVTWESRITTRDEIQINHLKWNQACSVQNLYLVSSELK